ncbi:zinc finger protein [Fusarium flagelliforme]|uniref:Zinc finger protein n=1 Tax=Fusarium flagelliforme TaxID=2675880 RepID=A0A395MRN8_9HYPO|nr:zinc finger protein [Fusarium flagelliforme]
MTYYCSDCDKLFFAGRSARDQHCQATGHALPAFECDSCSDCFDDEYDRCEHMNLEQHWAENAPECTICLFHAVTEEEVVRHEVEEHNYCADCKRTFMNLNCIRQHLNGKIHPTGLSHHLERGACPRMSMNRHKLYKYIKNRDPKGSLTNKTLAWEGEKTYSINPRLAWNHWVKAYECYLCHKLYSSLHGLKMHLESPRHQQKLYHCMKPSCSREFTTLAALINHLESEVCKLVRFQQVQKVVERIVDPHMMISV